MKIGFIGAGAMGGAIIKGLLAAVSPSDISVLELSAERRADFAAAGMSTPQSYEELAAASDYIFIAVKPKHAEAALKGIAPYLGSKTLISIVTGYTAEKMLAILPAGSSVIRTMPNTPALVGKGMIAISDDSTACPEELAVAESLLKNVGLTVRVPAASMDAVTAVSGSGPAYVYMLIDAMMMAGIKLGLPKDLALTLAAQTVAGSGETVLKSNLSPSDLKDAVCSPAGTTIAAVEVLENAGFEGAVMRAAQAAAIRSAELTK